MQIKKWHMGLAATGAALILAGHFGAKNVHSRAIREGGDWKEVRADFQKREYSREEREHERMRTRALQVPMHEEIIGKHDRTVRRSKVRDDAPLGEYELLVESIEIMKRIPISGKEDRTWFDFYRSNVKGLQLNDSLEGAPIARADGNFGITAFSKSMRRHLSKMPNRARVVHVSQILVHEASHNYMKRIGLGAGSGGQDRFRLAAVGVAQGLGLKMGSELGNEYFIEVQALLENERAANSVSMRFLEDYEREFKRAGGSVRIEPLLERNDSETASYVRIERALKWHVYAYLAKAGGIAVEASAMLMVLAANAGAKMHGAGSSQVPMPAPVHPAERRRHKKKRKGR